jgi:hypothetical protein
MGVYYISYTGVITGSKELRSYNDKMAKSTMYDGKLTTFGKYCKHYDIDGGKSAEPFFDSIMAQIAIMNKTKFNKYFIYTPVKPITQRKDNKNNDTVQNLNNTNLKIYPDKGGITFKLIKDDTNTLVNRNNIPGYEDGEHIFVFSPISNHTFEYIEKKVNSNTNRNIFIHLQGENGLSDKSGNDVSKDVIGMTPHPGMFNNAFNLQGNLYNAIRFRKLMRDKATCYTVCLKRGDARDGNVNVGNFQGARLVLPTIMKDFYDNIINGYVKSNGSMKNNGSTKLNITYVCQDLYDKDNFVSLDQIVRASINRPQIHLVGRAFFNRPGFKVLNKMGPPFKNGKMLPGFKGLQFTNGLNATGAHNNKNFNTKPFKYDRVLSSRINKFILDAWKKCSSQLRTAITVNTKVDFMNQRSSNNMNNGRPIAFHENMFVNVVGFWLVALGKKYLSKAEVFRIFSKQNNNEVNRALKYSTEDINYHNFMAIKRNNPNSNRTPNKPNINNRTPTNPNINNRKPKIDLPYFMR